MVVSFWLTCDAEGQESESLECIEIICKTLKEHLCLELETSNLLQIAAEFGMGHAPFPQPTWQRPSRQVLSGDSPALVFRALRDISCGEETRQPLPCWSAGTGVLRRHDLFKSSSSQPLEKCFGTFSSQWVFSPCIPPRRLFLCFFSTGPLHI